jgi:hypothetical protein
MKILKKNKTTNCIHRDECACVVSVSDVLCNSQKKQKGMIKTKRISTAKDLD